ncbi:MAG: GNAT family N-acetyltransferase [Lachnospiraceae bacterium]|jgi:ribosomal protein S18 acetylase RimI-like enzyme|nr:GNAT family N-acetyltransferase [Lachnospiraceae bacterium]
MELKLIELTHKSEVCQTYEIYKHCMFMPTEEKFSIKADQLLDDNAVKIFACCNQDMIEGVIVVFFAEQHKMEVVGIAVDLSARDKGIGSYMINQVIKDYGLLYVSAETDNDAVGFYRKNGFSITEFPKTYDDETVIRYKCELTI